MTDENKPDDAIPEEETPEPGEGCDVDGSCPECGADLAVRTNRTTGHSFLGCSAFPKCAYTTELVKTES